MDRNQVFTGSGYGHYRRGERITGLVELNVGMLVCEWSRDQNARNVVKVTRVEADKFYGIFVNPRAPHRIRLASDTEFCIWTHDFAPDPQDDEVLRKDPAYVFWRAVYINKRQRERIARLLPNGEPRYVRIYDNGGMDAPNGSADRYTVIFTGNYPKGEGPHREWEVLGMSEAPFHPQGIGLHSGYPYPCDTIKDGRPWACWPPAIGRRCHLGKRIRFADLPSDCQRATLDDYVETWSLPPVDDLDLPYNTPEPSVRIASEV